MAGHNGQPASGIASIITAGRTASSTVPYTTTPQPSLPRPNYPEQRLNSTRFEVDGEQYPIHSFEALALPSDPYASQWWVTGTGLDQAWDVANGNGAVIAVIDTGFALDHEELAGRWLVNSSETGAATAENGLPPNCTSRGLPLNKSCNGLDDDGNGYADDYRGWDFVSDDNSPQAGETAPYDSSAFHGTAVAGIAAANANNGKGIAGVSPRAGILPLQALGDDGYGDTLTISRAIRYAADRGADVINLSLGSSAADSYIRQAAQYAISKGAIVVASAGNDGCDCMLYPANFPEVVAVGAYDNGGLRSSFSSYGTNLDILAPGSSMTLPSWSASNQTARYDSGLAGTSFAAPFISGLLADARSVSSGATWGELSGLLMQRADHRTMTNASPRSSGIGFGFAQAGPYLDRLVAARSPDVRYELQTLNADTLDSAHAYDCQGSAYPTLPLYLISAASPYFTVSEYQAARARSSGTPVTQRGFICAGLGTDPGVIRRINSPLEFLNIMGK